MEPFHRLLAPSVVNCLTCGKMVSRSTLKVGVCLHCYDAIPWIREPRCSICGRHIGCPDCTRTGGKETYFQSNRSAVAYNSMMRDWLGQYKYRGNEKYSELLVMMLEKALVNMRNEYRQNKGTETWNIDIITCVPVSSIRLEERGFNQAEVLAVGLADKMHLTYKELLLRERHTNKQSFKNRSERIRDMENVFNTDREMMNSVHNILLSRPRSFANIPLRILVIDDIYTTGSTINACARVLKEIGERIGHPVEVYSLTWARS
ncbi:hypothetical protein PNBC_12950 [Paenibacillus crassostreae]|uniref:Amidophosphoribosyltransferase n=2 Tax=Paenibacillus crassostreae TaxID=1763538 RepID=A0A167D948_9BACL|nr:hypothetical protein PNBC_12950 [Paenibacillus crassostreae]